MSGYLSNSLSPSMGEKIIKEFDPQGTVTSPFLESFQKKFPTVNERVQDVYENGLNGMDTVDGFFESEAKPVEPPAAQTSSGWTFITAPEDVSWDVANSATRVDIFGTNNPPVVAGSRGMRDLALSNSLVEGFVRGVTVEGKITALENLMSYGLNTSDGFVSVPVYQVWANSKSYGGSEAYYIIKDVKVKEAMRDLKGNATRAFVDISLMQVPAYQVNSGRDQASKGTAGGVALTPEQKAQAQKNAAAAAAAQVDGNKNKNATASPAGPNAGGPSEPAKVPASSAPPTRGRQNIPGVGDNG
jgi:hypothetical protein